MLVLSLVLPINGAPAANVDSAVRDTAARIDYGFYTKDLSLIVAARSAIPERSADPWTSYLRAYASYRAAQVSIALDRDAGRLIDDCIVAAEDATESQETEVEANVLVAACAVLAATAEPMRSVFHQRRFRRAAGSVQAAEPDNPRFLLIAYTARAELDAGTRPDPQSLLSAFAVRRDAFAFPDWGEAEALTAVGAERLQVGDRRSARDFIEVALLTAPDYVEALILADSISDRVTQR
jgi:hypothetical protein